ncbi:hypothetical protein DFH08DRAFT_819982 [Mycena albidolilacea]|uniref:Uncharacterized protein n=1 Tax=Mycena albidolilacea TaxID=1033008 RepID=A0AAD6ZDR7_9AGAR|nr:hypothetical protein DFH08DRAFT_819982 [Mycena albidolilacea]
MDPTHSSTDVGSTKGGEKFLGARGAFVTKLLGPPGKVVIGQLILQVAAWGFFATIWAKGFISITHFGLPQPSWYKPLQWAITLVSTVLSFFSSYLFSRGLRQAISLDLQKEGMSFNTFISRNEIASRTAILDLKQWNFMIVSIVVVVLTGMQTSGWNSLLLPTASTYNSQVRGLELDLANPLLRPMLASGKIDFCVSNSTRLVGLSVGQSGSGFATVNGDHGFPTSLTLMDNSFNTSTGGILPVAFRDARVDAWFPNTTSIPAALMAPSIGLNNGLVWNWAIIQQVNTTFINTMRGANQGYIAMIVCDGAESYQLILVGSGLYDYINTMVCTLTPQITTVSVLYSYDSNSDSIAVNPPVARISDFGGPAGISAVTTIFNMLFFAQGTDSNVVGGQFSALLANTNDSVDAVLGTAEEYLRGVAEYGGTVGIHHYAILRACLSAENGTFPDGVPSNLSLPITGTLHTQFFGWEPTKSVVWILIPGTIIAGATIFVVLTAVARHARDPARENEFDPSNTMQLVSASAAGGLRDVFTRSQGDNIQAAMDVPIAVGEFEGRERAFIIKHRNM